MVHRPAVNEELGADAVQGSQLASASPDKTCDGVIGIWYGKAPGLDRATDALRHGNLGGADASGGVLILVGDDSIAKSSTVPSSSEMAMAEVGMPVLAPADPQDVLDLGLHGIALSRFCGLWTGFKLATNVVDGAASVRVGLDRLDLVEPDRSFGGTGFVHEVSAQFLQPNLGRLESSLMNERLELARRYAAANHLNAIEGDSPGPGGGRRGRRQLPGRPAGTADDRHRARRAGQLRRPGPQARHGLPAGARDRAGVRARPGRDRGRGGEAVGAGIGCSTLAVLMPEERFGNIIGFTHMGGEGATWVGMEPFVTRQHLIQNIGDGTFHHSGSLAIRQAIASGTRITFKLLYNGAVAMTGGQQPVGAMPVPDVAAALLAEGARKVVITTEDPARYRRVRVPRGVEVRHRDRLDETQQELAGLDGVTVLIHDQECATELRRKRKRGLAAEPAQRVLINERVCEGCGDCGVASNCLSVQPVDTEFGRKTRIHQASCNKDFSCMDGDWPSFITVTPGRADQAGTPGQAGGRGAAGRGTAGRGTAGRGTAGRGTAGRGTAGRGTAGRGAAGRGRTRPRRRCRNR